jgi:hypothetical protein
MEITLGLLLARAGGSRLLLNPPRDVSWRLAQDDKVIVLAQQVYQ